VFAPAIAHAERAEPVTWTLAAQLGNYAERLWRNEEATRIFFRASRAPLRTELGLEPGDITQVLLAGSFGAYLSPVSAIRIGLVPRLALPRIVSAGNVAGEGAKMAALSLRERAEARSILDEVEYVELSGRADFNDAFVDQLAFPG
jgi:uncharacterized 2Fe-2S/4Fe-4S cluster protein (DUF4445 family)